MKDKKREDNKASENPQKVLSFLKFLKMATNGSKKVEIGSVVPGVVLDGGQGRLLQGGMATRNGALKKQMEAHPPDLILLFPYSDKRGFKTFQWFGKAHVHRVNLQDRGPDAIWDKNRLNTWFEAWDLGRRALEDGKTVACVCVRGKTRSLAMAHALQPTEENKPTYSPMLALAKCTSRADMLAFAPLDSNAEQSASATKKRAIGAVGGDPASLARAKAKK